MSDPRLPKALTFYEAQAQVAHAGWRLIEAVFENTPAASIALHAQRRSVEAWAAAFEHRANIVGRQQAWDDYTEDA